MVRKRNGHDLKEHWLNWHFCYRKRNKCIKLQLGLLSEVCKAFLTSLIIGWPREPQRPEIMTWGQAAVLGKAVWLSMPSAQTVQGQTDLRDRKLFPRVWEGGDGKRPLSSCVAVSPWPENTRITKLPLSRELDGVWSLLWFSVSWLVNLFL